MSELNSKDIREICDCVQEAVLDIVGQNLSKMKPQVVSEIRNKLICELEKTYSSRISSLESRIAKLEQQISDQGIERVQDDIKKKIRAHKIDVSKIYGGFKYNGWIYYLNEEMGDFLYKVREDGGENTQLTDYSVSTWPRFSIKNGYLCFADKKDMNDRKIKLED